jgi:hypothetical protein
LNGYKHGEGTLLAEGVRQKGIWIHDKMLPLIDAEKEAIKTPKREPSRKKTTKVPSSHAELISLPEDIEGLDSTEKAARLNNFRELPGFLSKMLSSAARLSLRTSGMFEFEGIHMTDSFSAWAVWSDNIVYTGDISPQNQRQGCGAAFKGTSVYIGNWEHSLPNGLGRMISKDGDRCEGYWRNGKPHGYSSFWINDLKWYAGDWRDGRPHGYGTIKISGAVYRGMLDEAEMHGDCEITLDDNSYYRGTVLHGSLCGFGVYINEHGIGYAGEWKDNEMHAEGILSHNDLDTEVEVDTFTKPNFSRRMRRLRRILRQITEAMAKMANADEPLPETFDIDNATGEIIEKQESHDHEEGVVG